MHREGGDRVIAPTSPCVSWVSVAARETVGHRTTVQPRFMVNCRVCKSLEKSVLWNGQWISGIEKGWWKQHPWETWWQLKYIYIYISRTTWSSGSKSKNNNECIFMVEILVVLKLSESKEKESRPHSKWESNEFGGPYQSLVACNKIPKMT